MTDDAWTILLSAIALLLSIISIVATLIQQKSLSSVSQRIDLANLHIERNMSFEGMLVEKPELLKMYGIEINPNMCTNDGVKAMDIVYVILSYNACVAYCASVNIILTEHLRNNEYRRRFFLNQDVINAWRYARWSTTSENSKAVDDYIFNATNGKYKFVEIAEQPPSASDFEFVKPNQQ